MKKVILLIMMVVFPAVSYAGGEFDIENLKKAYNEEKYLTAWDGFYNLASDNIPEAIYYVGLMSFWGKGKPKNYPYALNRFKSAGDYGYTEGLYMAGVMNLFGVGLKKEGFQDGYKYLRIAENLGHEKAKILVPFAKENLTPEQIDRAEAEVKNWKPKIPKTPN